MFVPLPDPRRLIRHKPYVLFCFHFDGKTRIRQREMLTLELNDVIMQSPTAIARIRTLQ